MSQLAESAFAWARANPLLVWVAVAGIAIRASFVIANGPASFDELITLQLARVPLADSWRYVSLDNVPPLYTWLLHAWGSVFGFSPAASRALSSLFAIPAGFLVYRLGLTFGGRGLARWALAVFAFAPFSAYYTVFIRAYSPLFVLSAASTLLFWQLLWNPSRRRSWLFALTTAGMLYCGSVGFGLVAAQALFLLLPSGGKGAPGRRLAVLSGAVAVLCFIPWLAASAWATAHSPAAGLLRDGWYFGGNGLTPLALIAPAGLIFNRFILTLGQAIVTLSILLPIAAAAAGIYALRIRSDSRTALYLGLCAFLPPLLWSLVFPSIALRYFTPSAIALYVVFGAALHWATGSGGRSWPRSRSVALVAASLLPLLFTLVHGRPAQGPEGFANWLQRSPVATIIADPNALTLTFAGLDRSRIKVVYPPSIAEQVTNSGDDLYDLIAFNWNSPFYTVSAEEFPVFTSRVAAAAGGADSINLVVQHNLSKAIKLALEDIGYRCVDFYPEAPAGSYVVQMELGLNQPSAKCRARSL